MSFRHATFGLTFILLLACGDSGTGTGGTGQGGQGAGAASGGSGAGGGQVGGSGASGGGGASFGCDVECIAPQFCSAAGECIDAGTCLADEDCADVATVCDIDTRSCVPGGGCEDVEVPIVRVPPNLLLVLDRSCSMQQNAGGTDKWTASVEAITAFTTAYAGQIQFGLTLFPDRIGTACAQGEPAVAVGPSNELIIQQLLQAALDPADTNYPDGPCKTPIDAAIYQAQELMVPLVAERPSYVALITDGAQTETCTPGGGDTGTTANITSMFDAGIPTFVVGFGAGVDANQLNIFAEAGGVPNADPSYYNAADQAGLLAVLEAMAAQAVSCTFDLPSAPPDPERIYVFFDDVSVPSGEVDSWTYNPDTLQIELHGAACDGLRTGEIELVNVVFGCADPS